jgi:hypothetical protein
MTEHKNLYTSPYNITMVKSKRIIRAGRVARTRELIDEFSSEQLEGRRHLEEMYIGGRIILK